MKYIANMFIKIPHGIAFLIDKILVFFYKKEMKSCGKQIYIRPLSSNFKGLYNLFVGNNVSILRRSTFYCTEVH